IYEPCRDAIVFIYDRVCAIVKKCWEYLEKLWNMITSCFTNKAQTQEIALEQIAAVRRELAQNMHEFTDGNMTPAKVQKIDAICSRFPNLSNIQNSSPKMYEVNRRLSKEINDTLTDCDAIKSNKYTLTTIPENCIVGSYFNINGQNIGPVFFRVINKDIQF